MKLLIIGVSQAGQMGSYLAGGARKLGIDFEIVNASKAEATSRIGQSFFWRLRGKRPGRLRQFGAEVLSVCMRTKPDLVLTTGRAPLERWHIEKLRALGAKIANYSTDDPWNPRVHAPWFLSVVPCYDVIFTPRRANLDDFRRSGVQAVHYLPFGYDPEVHCPWPNDMPPGAPSDVLFVGGCDAERLPLIGALIDAGFNLALFGGYWNRHAKTRPFWRGIADQNTIRAASASACICLCLVRRSNRDGNVMRSFEAAAIGGCILAEDTPDHRELLGDAARYFSSPTELVREVKRLIADPAARMQLSARLRERMMAGRHTYADRLASMLQMCGKEGLRQCLLVSRS
jgi:hypothetical protein